MPAAGSENPRRLSVFWGRDTFRLVAPGVTTREDPPGMAPHRATAAPHFYTGTPDWPEPTWTVPCLWFFSEIDPA